MVQRKQRTYGTAAAGGREGKVQGAIIRRNSGEGGREGLDERENRKKGRVERRENRKKG